MTEESPSRRGDSSSRDDSSDVATSPADPGAAQDKGKGVARESQEGRDGDGEPAADSDQDESEEDSDDDDEEDEEPKLKYARLTQHLGPVYRNGDATSAFLVAGDKMVRPTPPILAVDILTSSTRSSDPIMETL